MQIHKEKHNLMVAVVVAVALVACIMVCTYYTV